MLTIYGVPLSVHTRKVILCALHKGLAYKLEPVIPFQPPPKWAELSPTGLIPVIDDDGFKLPDSTAICHYLERRAPDKPLLPRGDQDAARAMFIDAYAGGELFRRVVHGLFFQRIIRPGMMSQATDQAAIEAILNNERPKVFAYLETQLDGSHFIGNALSIADLAIASNLINYRYLGYSLEGHPRLGAFLDVMIARPEFKAALKSETPFAEQMGLDRSFAA